MIVFTTKANEILCNRNGYKLIYDKYSLHIKNDDNCHFLMINPYIDSCDIDYAIYVFNNTIKNCYLLKSFGCFIALFEYYWKQYKRDRIGEKKCLKHSEHIEQIE